MGAATVQLESFDAKVAARKALKGYGPGNRQRSENAYVKKDKLMATLMQIWEDPANLGISFKPFSPIRKYYDKVCHVLRENDVWASAEDVRRFSFALGDLQDAKSFSHKAGMIISALINNGSEDDYIVPVDHLVKQLDLLCFQNEKNVLIKGNVDAFLGEEMSKGKVVVEGNVGDFAGDSMSGGTIIICGDADNDTGVEMGGGLLVVKGNVDFSVGAGMKGGRIIVEKNAGIDVGSTQDTNNNNKWIPMTGGEIIIFGNAGSHTGRLMRGGRIVIRGNSLHHVGMRMVDGEIVIKGSSGNFTGNGMEGGVIRVGGDWMHLGEVHGGRIFHEGELIVDR